MGKLKIEKIQVNRNKAVDNIESQGNETGVYNTGVLVTNPLTVTTLAAEVKQRKDIVFIDPTVENYQNLAAGVKPGTEVIVLDSARDGVEQITEALASRSNIDSVQILSHGGSGSLHLGAARLNSDTINSYASQLQNWSKALTADADILVYGCDVAAGEVGEKFIQKLSNLTGADIAASTNLTGSSALGGDWDLEKLTGSIESPIAFQADAIADYQSVLIDCVPNVIYAIAAGKVLITSVNTGGSITPAVPNTLPFSPQAVARDPLSSTNLLYYLEPTTNGRLGTWNPTTGAATVIANSTTIPGSSPRMAFRNNGVMYAMVNNNLYTVSTGTGSGTNAAAQAINTAAAGTTTLVATVPGATGSGDMAFDPTSPNDLYIVNGGTILKVNINTPTTVLATGTTGLASSPGVAFGPDGFLYAGTGTGLLARLNTTVGPTFGNQIGTALSTIALINDFATLPTPSPDTDLAVTKTDGQTTTSPGNSLTYTITVKNNGDCDLKGISFVDNIPTSLTGITWTASIVGGGGFPTPADASGTGNAINTKINLNSGATATYIVTGTVSNSALGTTISNTASATPPEGITDRIITNNNSASDSTAVLAPNVPPVTNNATASVTPGSAVQIPGLGSTDSDGTIVSYTINTLPPVAQGVLFLGNPASGGVAITAGQVLTPAQISQVFLQSTGAFVGTNFSYSGTDNRGASTPGTATVSPVPNVPPVTNSPTAAVTPGTTIPLTGLGATDPDGTIASYTVSTLPPATEGVLFLGNPATGGVAVTAGQTLTPAQISQLFFQSTGTFNGTNFTYSATDNRGGTTPGTTTISPTPNQPPVTNNTSVLATPGSAVPVTGLGATDPDGTIASYTVNTLPPATEGVLFLGNPAAGGVAVTAGQVLTPAQIDLLFFQSTGTFNGTNFTYSGTDNRGASTPGTATLSPTPNQPPLTNNSNASVTPGAAVQIPGLGATDPDGTIVSYAVNTLPPATEGVLFLGNPAAGGVPITIGQVLTPAQINQVFLQSTGTFAGTNFTYSATDNRGASSPGTATVSPTPNQPPVTNNANSSVIPGNTIPLTGLGATDADGTIASYTVNTLPPATEGVLFLGDPTQGGVAVTAGQTLTPAQISQLFFQSTGTFNGTNFTYSATDNRGGTTPATATVSPTPNQPPIANNTNASVTPGSAVLLTGLGGTDADGTIASYTVNTLPPGTEGVLFLGDPASGGVAVTAGQSLTPAQINQLFFQSTGTFNGTNFTYSATDNRGGTSSPATTSVAPTPNQPPVTNNTNDLVVPGNTVPLTGLGGSDPDGTIVSYTVNTLPPTTEGVLFLGDPTQGGVAVTAGQVLTPAQINQLFFQSTGAFAGTNFTYGATDNRGATSVGTASVAPTPNQPPVANNTNNPVTPGSTIPIAGLGGNDPDGTIASYTINTLPPAAEGVLFLGDPTQGGVAVTAGQVLTPAQISQLFFQSTGTFNGTNFTYGVTDNRGATTAATSTLSVTPNQPPVANNTNSSVAPGSTIAIAGLGGTDPDGTIASYTINTLPAAAEGVLFLGNPAAGGVAVTAGQVLTPAQISQLFFQSTNALAGANFTYSATDNRGASSPATATITPTANQPPVATNISGSLTPGSTVQISGLGGTDPDGTIASYTINTLPPAAQGVLFLGNPASGGTAIAVGQSLTPAQISQVFFQSTNALTGANFNYSAIDNRGAAGAGTASLSPTQNQPPVTNNTNATVAPGSTVAIAGLGGTDPDGTIASYTINTLPPVAQGVLFLGDPAAGGVAVTAGQSLTPAQISQLFFQSTGTFNGTNFTYSATDNRGATTPATASVSPTANQPPIANNVNSSVIPGNTIPLTTLGGSDPDGTIASYTIGGLPPVAQGVLFLGNPASGGVAVTAGQSLTPAQITQLFFQSAGTFTGTNFTYSATDNRGASSPATATLAPDTLPNDPPVANNVSLAIAPSSTVSVPGLGGSDSDGNVTSYTINTLPPAAQGVLFRGDPAQGGNAVTIGQTLSPGQIGQLFFQSTGNFSGTTFTYSATDNGNLGSPGPATVNLTATANQPPVANNANASVIPGNSVAIAGLGATDADGTIASYAINTLPPTAQGVLFLGDPATGGVAVTAGQSLTPAQITQLFFQSTGTFSGANFTYNATDNRGASSAATATVSPTTNRPPLTNNASLSAVPGSTVSVPGLGGNDPDGTIASYTINTLPPAAQGVLFLGNPATGGVAVTAGQVLTPAQISQVFFQSTGTFTGATFTYSATDNLGLSSPAAATVAASPIANLPPVANNANAAIAPGSTVAIAGLGGTDPDGTIASYTINTLPPAAQGILFLGDPALGGVAVTAGQVLTPAQISQLFFQSVGAFSGANFTYNATDNRGASSPGTVTLGANAAVNQPPVANNASLSAVPGSTVSVPGLGGSDPDGTIASYTINTLPAAAQGVLFLGDPANGGVAVTAGQSLTPAQISQLFFQSAGTFTGTNFTYSAIDNLGLASPGAATVSANPIANKPPIANNVNDLVAPGSTVQIDGLGGTDPDGTIASYTINTLPPAAQGVLFLGDPASGGVAVTAGQTLTPAQISQLFFKSVGTFSGANFTYNATDNRGASSPGTATLVANAGVNQPPLVNNANALIAPGTTVPITGLGGTDADGTIASYTINTLPPAAQGVLFLGNPASGGIAVTPGQVLTPAQIGQLFFQSTGTFTGANFTYSATDNLGLKSPAVATVTAISPANLPPVANNANTVLAPGSIAPITGLGGTDPDGTIASYTINTLPATAQGILFLGNPASGGVAVTAGQSLTPAQIGQLFFQSTGVFSGANFTYNATDNRGASGPATANLAPSTAANQPPLTNNANVLGLPGSAIPIAGLGGTDPSGTIAAYTIDTLPPADQGVLFLGDPAQGGVPVTAGQTLTPAQGNQLFFRSTNGFDSAKFTYTAIDNLGVASPSPATVALSATPNQPPVANNSNALLAPSSIIAIPGLGGTDPDGTIASYTINTLPPAAQGVLFLGYPANGGVAVTAGQTLTPAQISQLFFQSTGTFTGANFTYSATDNRGSSGIGTATINASPVTNQPPVANNTNALVAPNGIIRVPGLGGTDPDGSIASYTIDTLPPAAQGVLFLGDPTQGGVAVTAGQVLTPEQINQLFFRSTGTFNGANFTYRATDNQGLLSPGAATATINPLSGNQPPVTQDINTNTAPGSILQLTGLGATDADGSIASYTIDTLPPAAQGTLFLGDPANGGVAVTAGQNLTPAQISQLFFQSAGEFAGTNFTYSATDNLGASSRGTATINVTGAPAPALPNPPAPALTGEPPLVLPTPVAQSDEECDCPPIPEKPQPKFSEPLPAPSASFDKPGAEQTPVQQILTGTDGNDVVAGGDADEKLIGLEGNDIILGEGGTDLIYAKEGNDFIAADKDNDIIYSGKGRDWAFAGKGNDWMLGDTESDTLFGDIGDDTIIGDNGKYSNSVNSASSGDLLCGEEGNDLIGGNEGNDTILAGKGNDLNYGGRENDLMWGEVGNDTLVGDEGNDSLFGGFADDSSRKVDGNDWLYGGNGNDFLNGEAGDDTLVGGTGNDIGYGGKNHDRIYGELGADTLYGGEGKDTIIGDYGNIIANIVGQADLIFGDRGDDAIAGGNGNDTIEAGKDNDCVFGGKENDLIWGELGSDTIAGDEGNDTIYGGVKGALMLDTQGRDLLFGNAGFDYINGDESDDSISGGTDGDTLHGGKDADIIHGDGGGDLMFGDNGNDTLCGGDDNDTIFGDNIGASVAVGAAGQQDCIDGGAGNDLINGNEGQDTITGDEGNDTLTGGKDNDLVFGGEGDDWLFGDLGEDTLNGGAGSDRFVLSSSSGIDTITNFEVGIDKFVLSGGLSLQQVQISQTPDSTLLQVAGTGEVLARLIGANNQISLLDFVLV
jgi:Ca2+-binding RTX toxin-like protein